LLFRVKLQLVCDEIEVDCAFHGVYLSAVQFV